MSATDKSHTGISHSNMTKQSSQPNSRHSNGDGKQCNDPSTLSVVGSPKGSTGRLEDLFREKNQREHDDNDVASVSSGTSHSAASGTSHSATKRLSLNLSERVSKFNANRNDADFLSPMQSLLTNPPDPVGNSPRPKLNDSPRPLVRRSSRKMAIATRLKDYERETSKNDILRVDLLSPEDVKRLVKSSRNNNRLDPILDRYENLSEEASKERRELAAKIAARERRTRLGCIKSKTERKRFLEQNRARFSAIRNAASAALFGNSDDASIKARPVPDEVRAAPYDFTNFVPPSFRKSEIQRKLILSVIERSFVFTEFRKHGKARSAGALDALIDAFEPVVFPPAHVILNEGEKNENNKFYVVEQGNVNFEKNGKFVSKADEVGEYFGELALLYNITGDKTVSAYKAGETSLLKIEQKVFRGILRTYSKRAAQEKRDSLLGVDFLHDLIKENETLTLRLSSLMIREELTLDQTFSMSQDKTFVVIQSGQMEVPGVERILNPKDYFGSRALIGSLPRQSTNKADLVARSEKVVLFRIDNHAMGRIVGPSRLQNLMDMRRFATSKLIQQANLSNSSHDLMAQKISNKKFDKQNENTWEVDPSDPAAVYVVREGILIVSSNDENTGKEIETVVKPGSVFGHEQLKLSEEGKIQKYNRVAGLKATSPEGQSASIGILPLAEIENDSTGKDVNSPFTADKSADDSIQKESRESEHHESYSSTLQLRGEVREIVRCNVSVEDLEKIRLLGEGEFGEVWLVAANVFREGNPEVRQNFALKSQFKVDLTRGAQAADNIRKEIEIMQELRHSQIVDLVSSYEDEKHIHMLMRLVPHGELWDRIHVEDDQGNWLSGLPEDHAKFYAMSIADTLNFMHSRSIIYRDLKPENVLIDADGYPVIVDFGFAKFCPDKTYTFVGTPKYVAPEIITNAGHNRSADYWAFGVTVYEMITGENPFFFEDMDTISLFDTICREKYFPLPEDKDEQLVDFVDKLLQKDPTQRLGMLARGIDDILQHQWFDDLDLQQVRAKSFPAPWKPTQIIDDGFESMKSGRTPPACGMDDSVISLSVLETGDNEENVIFPESKSKIKAKKSLNESIASLSIEEIQEGRESTIPPESSSRSSKEQNKPQKSMNESLASLSIPEIGEGPESTTSMESDLKMSERKKKSKKSTKESVGPASPGLKSKRTKEKKELKLTKPKPMIFNSSMNSISYSDPQKFQYVTPEYMIAPEPPPVVRRTEAQRKESDRRRSLLQSSFANFGIDDFEYL